MKASLTMLEQGFESSSGLTPQFAAFYKTFRREFRKDLESLYKVKEFVCSRGHFYVSGFFELEDGRIYYFNYGDVRWNKSGYIRTAKDFKDYTGGQNHNLDITRPDYLANLPKAYATN